METLNVNPKETSRTFWHIVAGICLIALVWRLPDILTALK